MIRVFPDIGLLESGDAAFEDEECLIVAKGRRLRMQEHCHVRCEGRQALNCWDDSGKRACSAGIPACNLLSSLSL